MANSTRNLTITFKKPDDPVETGTTGTTSYLVRVALFKHHGKQKPAGQSAVIRTVYADTTAGGGYLTATVKLDGPNKADTGVDLKKKLVHTVRVELIRVLTVDVGTPGPGNAKLVTVGSEVVGRFHRQWLPT